MLVAWLTAVTVRPGTAPPDSSDTMPVTVARPVWAAAVVLRRSPASAMKLNRGTQFADARIGDSLVGIPGDGHGGSVPENQRGVQTLTPQRSFTRLFCTEGLTSSLRGFELLPILRVERLWLAEHRLARNVVLGCHFVDERILFGQIMWNARTRFASFEGRHAWRTYGGHGCRAELKAFRQDPRLGEVDRILDHGEHGEKVAVPGEARRDRRLVAARRTRFSEEARLHMSRVGDERVAFPRAGRETRARVQRIIGWVRPAVHPDGHRRTILPCTNRPRHDRAFDRLGVAPDPQTKQALHEIECRPPLTLPFDHVQLRLGITQRLRARLVVQRHARVVHREPVACEEFMISCRP